MSSSYTELWCTWVKSIVLGAIQRRPIPQIAHVLRGFSLPNLHFNFTAALCAAESHETIAYPGHGLITIAGMISAKLAGNFEISHAAVAITFDLAQEAIGGLKRLTLAGNLSF